jgi:DNA-binding CsgD family transcriptional regulator
MKPLTRRQWVLWACWVSGMTSDQICASLGITDNTVQSTLRRIRTKVGPISRYAGPFELPHK